MATVPVGVALEQARALAALRDEVARLTARATFLQARLDAWETWAHRLLVERPD